MERLLSYLLGSRVTHVLHTSRISNDERVLYNDTETLIKATKSFTRFICDTRSTYITTWTSNDDRVLYNDTETMILRFNILLSYLLDSYVTQVLHTARISNDQSHCMYNDMKTLIKTLLRLLTVLSMLFF